MFTVITGAEVYAPEALGAVDVLVVGERIAAVGTNLASAVKAIGSPVETIELKGLTLTPGLIDGHYHPLGGGDYEGPLGRVTSAARARLGYSNSTIK